MMRSPTAYTAVGCGPPKPQRLQNAPPSYSTVKLSPSQYQMIPSGGKPGSAGPVTIHTSVGDAAHTSVMKQSAGEQGMGIVWKPSSYT